MAQDEQKKSGWLANKAGSLIKDNAKSARDGMIYYLDTLWKLPGAYMASNDKTSRERLSRKRIRRLEDVEQIKRTIEESGSKINSVMEWVNLAKDGTWSEDIKNSIRGFDELSVGVRKKIELLELDYKYFADSFFHFDKDKITMFFSGSEIDRAADAEASDISASLRQVELIGSRAYEAVSEANKLEKDIERFVDRKLFGSKGAGKKKIKADRLSWGRRLVTVSANILRRTANTVKLATACIYYIARIVIFLIKYFILLPAAFAENIIGIFKKKKKS